MEKHHLKLCNNNYASQTFQAEQTETGIHSMKYLS